MRLCELVYFANTPREVRALGRRYSALLNSIVATRYNQASEAIIPLLAMNMTSIFTSVRLPGYVPPRKGAGYGWLL